MRTARECAKATGARLTACGDWAAQGLISRFQPVPDGWSGAQRSFEAYMVNVLANALRDHQLNGALFGVATAVPAAEALTLLLDSDMADRVLAELLPRFDLDYGGLRGVPGLRAKVQGATALVHDLSTGACVTLAKSNGSTFAVPADHERDRPLWKSSPRSLDPGEREDLALWEDRRWSDEDVEARDFLLSRLLRRPRIVNSAAGAHGWANTYSHGTSDLVIEWCCGGELDQYERWLRRSGVAATPQGLDRLRSTAEFPGTIDLGQGRVYLRRQPSCTIPHNLISEQELDRQIREEYRR
ncbi:hypothetical protein AB0K43_08520 [Kitasatospora sp. NPDC049258]|uniref:hypothetical protein n=1 Tax=Kitasatospora sp. NPDC049258 TaxID=3155394 RepID=UPI0034194DB1